jgi:hypothetical protein
MMLSYKAVYILVLYPFLGTGYKQFDGISKLKAQRRERPAFVFVGRNEIF